MQIKNLSVRHINWIIISLYLVFCLWQLLFSSWSTMDAAGRGMAQGFLMIYTFYVLVLAGLNLIRAKWMSYVVLVLCLLPLLAAII